MLTSCGGGGSDPVPEPEASFTSSISSIKVGESVTFTNTSENVSEIQWIFQGGSPSSSTSDNPTVTYNSPGSFSVTLTAVNETGTDTDSRSGYVNVEDPTPIADFSVESTVIAQGSEVVFTNLSTNGVAYFWEFEGGSPASSNEANPSVTYASTGIFDVTLTVTNSSGTNVSETKTDYLEVQALPIASFQTSTSILYEGEGIYFYNYSSNATEYSWTLNGGDPSSSTSADPGYVTFATAGTYTLGLTASNDVGSDYSEVTVTVYESPYFDLTMQNYLYFGVYIYRDGSYIGYIDARGSQTFSNLDRASSVVISWDMNTPAGGGIDLAAQWTLSSPTGDVGLEIDNVIGSNTYQYIIVDNNVGYNLYSNVNPGTADEYSSGNYYVPAYQYDTYIGYTKFVELDNQIRFYNNSSRTSSYWWVNYSTNVIDEFSGRVDILFSFTGSWDSGSWNGEISRETKEVTIDPNYRSDWDIPLVRADFSKCTIITQQDLPIEK